jgi:hypothetical protein
MRIMLIGLKREMMMKHLSGEITLLFMYSAMAQ